MKRYVRPNRACSSSSRLMICAWIETSSADTGSSHTMNEGSHRERARDADALPLSARQLVRIALGHVRQRARPARAAPRPSARAARAVGSSPWTTHRLRDDLPHRHARIERAVRVLEDDLHPPALTLERLAAGARRRPRPSKIISPRSAFRAAGACARSSSCRSPTRLRAPVSRRGGSSKRLPSTARTTRRARRTIAARPTLEVGLKPDAQERRRRDRSLVAAAACAARVETQAFRADACHLGAAHACRPMAAPISAERRLSAQQRSHLRGTARREPAAGRRIEQIGRRPSIVSSLRAARLVEPGTERSRPACRDGAVREESRAPCLLDDTPRVHDVHAIGVARDDAQVVRDHQHRDAELARQPLHQLEDLRLDRHVERGGRLVGDEQLRIARERHRDHHALAHAAARTGADTGRAGARRPGCRPAQQLDGARARRGRVMPRWICSGSVSWRPMVSTGFSDVIGSWKIIAISRPRISRISSSESSRRSRPLNSDLARRRCAPAGSRAAA